MILVDANVLMYAAGTEHPNRAPSLRYLEAVAAKRLEEGARRGVELDLGGFRKAPRVARDGCRRSLRGREQQAGGPLGPHDRSLDADALVGELPALGRVGRHHAPQTDAEPAGHVRLQGQLAGDAVLEGQPADGPQHRLGPARLDQHAPRGLGGQPPGQRFDDPTRFTQAAVLGRHHHLGALLAKPVEQREVGVGPRAVSP